MPQQVTSIIFDLKEWLISGLVGAFGAFGRILYSYSKGHKTSIVKTIVTILVGFFVGNLVGSFIPIDMKYRDGILMVAGFGCYPILDILEQRISCLFKDFFNFNK